MRRVSLPSAAAVLLPAVLLLAACGASTSQRRDGAAGPGAHARGARSGVVARAARTGPASGEATCALQPVYFAFDSAELDARARDTLSANLRCVETSHQVTITGTTDPRGTEEYNLALGERRAQAAARYLGAQGVDGSRVNVHSTGDHFSAGSDESSWALDRRAELQSR